MLSQGVIYGLIRNTGNAQSGRKTKPGTNNGVIGTKIYVFFLFNMYSLLQ